MHSGQGLPQPPPDLLLMGGIGIAVQESHRNRLDITGLQAANELIQLVFIHGFADRSVEAHSFPEFVAVFA